MTRPKTWSLAFGIYDQTSYYLTSDSMLPDCRLNRKSAERIVD